MRPSFTAFWLYFSLLTATSLPAAPPSHDWQESTSQLHPGDHVRLFSRTGPVDGQFLSSTPQNITVGSTTTPREAVLKIQRYRLASSHPTRRRVINGAIGAAIGFGVGFGIGKTDECKPNSFLCGALSNDLGLIFGGGGLLIGGTVGALLPERHAKETVYSY